MRSFSSYGPVDPEEHFCLPRNALVRRCLDQLVGKPEKGGHYFTIWAPRQTGKTWLMRRVAEDIHAQHGDRFTIAQMSCQGVIMAPDMPETAFLDKIPKLMLDGFGIDVKAPKTWEDWILYFHKRKGLFDKPLILFIDEFDNLPPTIIDRIVSLFRDVYLNHADYVIHGLALIGVRAVLGVESERGSPFNIQRSLHVPNFTSTEVSDLFRQYKEESGQAVEPEVVSRVYTVTQGQPGLVGWFGELLTTTYNPGSETPIDVRTWNDVYEAALHKEWNNTILNLIKKARGPYLNSVLELFEKSDLPFSIHAEWCNYLYLNGIVREKVVLDPTGRKTYVCRFSSPFVQTCLFHALTHDLVGDRFPILPLEPLDDPTGVFDKPDPDLPSLLKRYRRYLDRLKDKGIDPWKKQPRRTDLHPTEAVGHFHLYAWLRKILEDLCVVSPEFPTGNGKVDLHLDCGDKTGIIEVKSFKSLTKTELAKRQAAAYAKSLSLGRVTIALFIPMEHEEALKRLSDETDIDGVKVSVVAIGWGKG